jgi:uncharacterized protein
MAGADEDVLSDDHVLEYPYLRSLGPVLGAFFTELRDGRITGVLGSGGAVICPPTEYDPQTGEATGQAVSVGPEGTVTTWAWVAEPRPQHPLDTPFAWVLVTLDGASTALLHVLDAPGPERVRSGMRVVADFRPDDERVGAISDIRAFVPLEAAG